MSSLRTISQKSVTFTIAIAGSALALSAVGLGITAAPAIGITAAPAIGTMAAPAIGTTATSPAFLAATPPARPAIHLVSARTPVTRSHVSRRLTPRQVARRMLRSFGWRPRQFRYLNWLWDAESGWNVFAQNPWSGAYGIPQAMPGAKMAAAGANWRTSARTQIAWGLGYIRDVYGTPHGAWDHEIAVGWY